MFINKGLVEYDVNIKKEAMINVHCNGSTSMVHLKGNVSRF